MDLTIQVKGKQAGLIEMALEGRLDTQTCATFEQRAAEVLAGEVRSIRVDMAGLEYISSLGLRAILRLLKQMRARQGTLILVRLQPQVRKIFEIANALPAQTVFTSLEEADAYFDAMQKRELEKIEEQARGGGDASPEA
jgi:anti-anti-sigma factor